MLIIKLLLGLPTGKTYRQCRYNRCAASDRWLAKEREYRTNH